MQQQADYYELNEDSKAEQLRHAEILRKYEAQKRARSINVPTAIEEVLSTRSSGFLKPTYPFQKYKLDLNCMKHY